MEQKYVFEFTFQELMILTKGLKELAYKESAGLIANISTSYEKQAKEIELAKRDKTKEVSKAK